MRFVVNFTVAKDKLGHVMDVLDDAKIDNLGVRKVSMPGIVEVREAPIQHQQAKPRYSKRRDMKPTPMGLAILAALSTGPKTRRELIAAANDAGHGCTNLFKAMRIMIRKDWAQRNADGRYQLKNPPYQTEGRAA